MTTAQPPTGDKIAFEVEKEMELRLYRLRNAVLAPSEYHIYLHPDDFRHIELVVPRIVLDVQTCLNELVEKLNAVPLWTKLLQPKKALIEVPAGGWAIHINPAVNGEAAPGELAIVSRLSVPKQASYGSGAGTVRIAQTIVSGTDRRTSLSEETKTPGTAAASPGTGAGEAANSNPHRPRLVYTDDLGTHVHFISKELTKVGRGGEAHWVDLTVVSGTRVSREHCHIRRDGSGRYFLRDVSGWGTSLNGTPIPKYLEGGIPSAERELTEGASIQLADAVVLGFHTK